MKKRLNRSLLTLIAGWLFSFGAIGAYEEIQKHPETLLGEKAYAAGQYDNAIEHFQKAIDAGETRGEPHFFIGSIMEYRRQYREAIPYFAAAVEHELTEKLEQVALWKLILLLRNEHEYIEMLNYIERLEALGITHKNIDRFKEEAAEALTPEKLEAHELLSEARRVLSEYESENPGRDFWNQQENRENVSLVLRNYERAIYLDADLFPLYNELAGYYEKLHEYDKAVAVYKKIIYRSDDLQARYRVGVVLKKAGDFDRALSYLNETLEKSREKTPLQYFTLINLSQVLFALGRYEKGAFHAAAAQKLEESGDFRTPSFPVGGMMYCLNAVRLSPEENSSGNLPTRANIVKVCSKSLAPGLKEKLPPPLLPLYELAGLGYRSYQEAGYEKLPTTLFLQLLLPPEKRNVAPSPELVQDSPVDCEQISSQNSSSWRCLPNWSYIVIPELIEELHKRQDWPNLLTALSLYKKEIELYTYYSQLAEAYTGLQRFRHAVQIYERIRNRDIEQEKKYLKSLSAIPEWEKFQKEAVSYYRKFSYSQKQEKQFFSDYILQEDFWNKIPREERLDEFQRTFSIRESEAPEEFDELSPLEVEGLPNEESPENEENSEGGEDTSVE